jgi:hypothetical protein
MWMFCQIPPNPPLEKGELPYLPLEKGGTTLSFVKWEFEGILLDLLIDSVEHKTLQILTEIRIASSFRILHHLAKISRDPIVT